MKTHHRPNGALWMAFLGLFFGGCGRTAASDTDVSALNLPDLVKGRQHTTPFTCVYSFERTLTDINKKTSRSDGVVRLVFDPATDRYVWEELVRRPEKKAYPYSVEAWDGKRTTTFSGGFIPATGDAIIASGQLYAPEMGGVGITKMRSRGTLDLLRRDFGFTLSSPEPVHETLRLITSHPAARLEFRERSSGMKSVNLVVHDHMAVELHATTGMILDRTNGDRSNPSLERRVGAIFGKDYLFPGEIKIVARGEGKTYETAFRAFRALCRPLTPAEFSQVFDFKWPPGTWITDHIQNQQFQIPERAGTP